MDGTYRIDELVEKNDKTFYQALPKEIADKMQRGGSYLDGCGVFESVTMLYAGNYSRSIHEIRNAHRIQQPIPKLRILNPA